MISGGAGGRYSCECAPGWEGFSCEINTNDCRSSPCANNGTCVDKLAGYECNCAFGYTGKKSLKITKIQRKQNETTHIKFDRFVLFFFFFSFFKDPYAIGQWTGVLVPTRHRARTGPDACDAVICMRASVWPAIRASTARPTPTIVRITNVNLEFASTGSATTPASVRMAFQASTAISWCRWRSH